jgi:hypothetical protein
MPGAHGNPARGGDSTPEGHRTQGAVAVPDFDLFISYRNQDAEQVLPLVAALRERGLSVWFDQHAIGEFAPITDEIRHGSPGPRRCWRGIPRRTPSRDRVRWS